MKLPKLLSKVLYKLKIKNEILIEEMKLKKQNDYITYAKYKVIRDRHGRIIDLLFVFVNEKMKNLLLFDPINSMRSQYLPDNEKLCKYALNSIDLGVAKHFSYQSNVKGFEYIEAIMELDLADKQCVNVYTIDIEQLKHYQNLQNIRTNISTLLSMFNITLLHWNAKEHFIFSDNILTTNFNEGNPDLYTGNNIRSSYELYKITDKKQRNEIEKLVEKLLRKECSFLSFNIIVKNSIKENVYIKVNIIPENEDMYLIGIEY